MGPDPRSAGSFSGGTTTAGTWWSSISWLKAATRWSSRLSSAAFFPAHWPASSSARFAAPAVTGGPDESISP